MGDAPTRGGPELELWVWMIDVRPLPGSDLEGSGGAFAYGALSEARQSSNPVSDVVAALVRGDLALDDFFTYPEDAEDAD